MAHPIRFAGFTLDPVDRRLTGPDGAVDLPPRYFDALALLAASPGELVSKDRFLDTVWHGVPVTDEALTQCIRSLRRALGDDAQQPRFIATVPKHGYRFVAPTDMASDAPAPRPPIAAPGVPAPSVVRRTLLLGGAGTLGGAGAGIVGGLAYGLVAVADGGGAASALILLVWLTVVVAALGAAGVGFGIAAGMAVDARRPVLLAGGGALGGMAVGGVTRLLGLDAFHLLLGRAPAGITGAGEGLALGAAVGLATWTALRLTSDRIGLAVAALIGGIAGLVIPLAGGRLMAGSLVLLTRSFPDSRLTLDPLGLLLGEGRFGPAASLATGAVEGALFALCIAATMRAAVRRLNRATALTAP